MSAELAELDDVLPLSRKQRRVLARSKTRVTLLEGSIRSGKTFIMLIAWLLFVAVKAPKRGALIMVGKSRDSLYRNIFEPIENDPTLAVFGPFIRYKQGAPSAQIFGRTVHVVGAADAKAESKIRGMTVAGAFVDELTTLPRDFFKQLLGRMSVTGAQMFATTNPDAPGHWLRIDYLDKLAEFPDWRVYHFDMDDNPGLSEDYKQSLRREYSGLWFDRFILGLWVAAEGAVYQEFVNAKHVIRADQLPNIDRVLIAGLDYGTTHRTRAYLLGMGSVGIGPDGKLSTDPAAPLRPCLFVLDEFAPDTATVGEHAAMFRQWLADQPVTAWRTPEWIAVDPAAAVMRQQLFSDGMTNVMRAHNAVLSGIQTVSSLLASSRLFIVGENSPKLVKMLPGYRWDSAATAKGLTKPVKVDDDEVDALRYAIYTSRRDWRDQIPLAPAQSTDTIELDDEERLAA